MVCITYIPFIQAYIDVNIYPLKRITIQYKINIKYPIEKI